MARVIEIGMSLPSRGELSRSAIEAAVETLARVNQQYLREHPDTPALRLSGVRYRRERRGRREAWKSIPEILREPRGEVDCEDLGAWRIAELRARGVAAEPLVRGRAGKYHILVKFPRVTRGEKRWVVVDPSRELGM